MNSPHAAPCAAPQPDSESNPSESPADIDWSTVCTSAAFKHLMAAKRKTTLFLLVPAVAFFLAVTLAAGLVPDYLAQPWIGAMGRGYGLIIAVYLVCWFAAIAYVRIASKVFDPLAAAVRREIDERALNK